MQNRIKEIRKELNLTREDLGSSLGVSKSTISGWENDRDPIPLERLVDLSNKYNYSLDYILDLTDKNIKYTKAEINPKTIGDNLKQMREDLGILQKDIIKLCSIHYVTYSNYERGVHTITGYNLYVICKKYHTSMDEILGRTRL